MFGLVDGAADGDSAVGTVFGLKVGLATGSEVSPIPSPSVSVEGGDEGTVGAGVERVVGVKEGTFSLKRSSLDPLPRLGSEVEVGVCGLESIFEEVSVVGGSACEARRLFGVDEGLRVVGAVEVFGLVDGATDAGKLEGVFEECSVVGASVGEMVGLVDGATDGDTEGSLEGTFEEGSGVGGKLGCRSVVVDDVVTVGQSSQFTRAPTKHSPEGPEG